jgi:hypothetical protein
VHTEAPDMHEVEPILHGVATWQALPAAQGAQVPRLHTLSVPHAEPFGIISPVSLHETIGEHVVAPPWHGLAGSHDSPSVHATHAPPLHTLPLPHVMPFGTLPDSMHTGIPVLHAVVPVRHGLPATTQLAPATQGTQSPVALHTLSFPHGVPGGDAVPVSLHVEVEPEQLSDPT